MSQPPPATEHPTAAGMYDYYLDGTHHTAADRAAAQQVVEVLGTGHKDPRQAAWANRGFLQRAVTWLAAQGIGQFLDIGAGLPTQNNTHDVARAVNPDARVLYVDHDPRAVIESRSLVRDLDGVDCIEGDLRDPDLLARPDVRQLIDLDRPVGLLVVGLLYFVPDEDDPWSAVARLLAAVPAGSCLALSHFTLDGWHTPDTEESKRIYARSDNPLHDRGRQEVTRFLDGLDIVPPYPGAAPALSYVGLWGAEDPVAADDDAGRAFYAAVASKPEQS